MSDLVSKSNKLLSSPLLKQVVSRGMLAFQGGPQITESSHTEGMARGGVICFYSIRFEDKGDK